MVVDSGILVDGAWCMVVHGGAWCMVHGGWWVVVVVVVAKAALCVASQRPSPSLAHIDSLLVTDLNVFFLVLFWYLAYTTTAHRITGRPDPDREQDAQHDRLGGAGRTPVPVLAPGAHRAPQTLCVRARATSLRVRNERPQPRRAARCRPRCD